MKLTALEIKQQQFEKSLRGYDPAEVQSFLSLVSSEWEHMVAKMREMETQVENLNAKIKHYERVEEALHETLQTAKDSAEHKLVGAKKEAKSIVEKAEIEANSIIREASQQRQQIRQSILRLLDRREEMIGNINSYLEHAQESLKNFSKDEASLFSIPKEDFQNNENHYKRKPEEYNQGEPLPPGAENLDDIIDEFD